MSSIQESMYYLQLWAFTTGPALKVMKHFFEVKILNTSNFEDFLKDRHNMHVLYHQYCPTIQCCECRTHSLASPRKIGCLIQKQFDMLYDNSHLPNPSHEYNMLGSKVKQYCLCKYSAKCSLTVSELDITLFYAIVQHLCASRMNSVWCKRIKEVRNCLAHNGDGKVIESDFENIWMKLKTATLGFAGELGSICEQMFQDEISRIKFFSTDELKKMLRKSNENQLKMLDTLNGLEPLQTTVEECKKTVDELHKKQEDHGELLSNIGSSIGQTTRELAEHTRVIGTLQHKINNLVSIIQLAVVQPEGDEKGEKTSDDNRKISVETQVDSSCLDEEKTIINISNLVETEIDNENGDKEKFYVANVKHKCIEMELVAFPNVFNNPRVLRKAVKALIDQLLEAGEIDTKVPGKLEINLTVKTLLTSEEMTVVLSVFDKHETLEDSGESEIGVKTSLNDDISLSSTIQEDPEFVDKADLSQAVEADSVNRERYSRISQVVTDTFPNILRNILRSSIPANALYQIIIKHLSSFTTEQQNNLQDLKLNSYDSLDVPLIYRLLRLFQLIPSPTKGWGIIPDQGDTALGDDIERMRHYRNKMAHKTNINITKNEFEVYFEDFCYIGHRMDIHFLQKTTYKETILSHKICVMNEQTQTKYENAMKELENMQLRFDKIPMQCYWGDSFEGSLARLRKRIQDEKSEGRKIVSIQIILQRESDRESTIDILNSLKDEINEGLIGIEFIEAELGSIKLTVKLMLDRLETDDRLLSTLGSFLEKILNHISEIPANGIEMVLVTKEPDEPDEDDPPLDTSKISSEPVHLHFNFEADSFETVEKTEQQLRQISDVIFRYSNGSVTNPMCTATFLPISYENESTTEDFGETQSPVEHNLPVSATVR